MSIEQSPLLSIGVRRQRISYVSSCDADTSTCNKTSFHSEGNLTEAPNVLSTVKANISELTFEVNQITNLMIHKLILSDDNRSTYSTRDRLVKKCHVFR